MMRLIGRIPRRVHVAVSGGSDSMCALDFLSGSHNVTALHFDHGTNHARHARDFVEGYCAARGIDLVVGKVSRDRRSDESQEEFWRNERIRFFREHPSAPVVTAHHLDDAVEWWVFTCLHGNPRLIPHGNRDSNVIRPFLATPKRKLVDWCDRKKVPYVIDPGNESRDFARNRIRHDILPHALRVNPGLSKVVKKRILAEPLEYTSGDNCE